jgi:malonyl-CoA O-methyltransferase
VNPVDKARVRAAFSRGASAYEEQARVQRRVVELLLERLAGLGAAPRRCLDVGAGTGLLLSRLRLAHPGLLAAGVDLSPEMARTGRAREPGAAWAVADAEALPFAAGSFDLLVSTSTLQWLPRLGAAFAEMGRVLRPGGLLAVALFGGETLWELRGAWREALPPGTPDRTHRFFDVEAVEAALREAGLGGVAVSSARLVEHHPDVLHLLRALKAIGAGNAAPGGAQPAGLGARRVTERMARAYQARHRQPEGIPATYEVVTAVGRRPG